MRISIICSSVQHPIYEALKLWSHKQAGAYQISLTPSASQLSGGDILLLISCSEIINKEVRSLYKHSLVAHASDLPGGARLVSARLANLRRKKCYPSFVD